MSEYRPGPASLHTRLVFERARTELPFCDRQDQAEALRGRLGSPLGVAQAGDVGLAEPDEHPADAHPSLLRISELRRVSGVFEVVPGVHQVRGLAERNVTFVDSHRGRILIDGPDDPQTLRAATDLLDESVGTRPILAALGAASDDRGAAIDGVEIESVHVHDPDAPEVLRWFPALGLLYAAGSVRHSLPPLVRDGVVRDPVAWSKALHHVLRSYRDELTVVTGAQDWPTWGNGRVRQLIADQRDLLRYVHDEVQRLGHRGHSVDETISLLRLPPALQAKWHARGYDSTIEAHVRLLHPSRQEPGPAETAPWQLPLPLPSAARFLSWAGGIRRAVDRLRSSYDDGDYGWVAQAGELVLAVEPEADGVRDVTARAYEQLSYQEENIQRRAAFSERARRLLTGRDERRQPLTHCVADRDVEQLLDHLAVRLVGPRAAQHTLQLRWSVEDTAQSYLLELHNGTLFATLDASSPEQVSIATDRAGLAAIACDHQDWRSTLRDGSARVSGDPQLLDLFFDLLDRWPCPHPTGRASALRPRPPQENP